MLFLISKIKNKIQKKQQDKKDVICNVQNVTFIFTVKRKQRQQIHSVTRKVMTCQKQVTKNTAINSYTTDTVQLRADKRTMHHPAKVTFHRQQFCESSHREHRTATVTDQVKSASRVARDN